MFADFFNQTLFGNTVSAYFIALGIFLAGVLAANIVRRLLLARLKRWAKRTSNILDEKLIQLIEKPVTYLLYAASFYVGINNIVLNSVLENSARVFWVGVTTLTLVQICTSLVEYSIRAYWIKRYSSATYQQSLSALIPALKVVVWAIGAVFLLDNLGFDISAVVASLGIGGIAVALASQGILADLFSYFSILFDRPFEIGDFVIVGDLKGTVEHIGIKTTRLRSIDGEEWVASNTDLTGARIQNYKRMERRRIAFSLGVTYDTGQAHMEAIPGIIRRCVEVVEGVTFDRAHFQSFGDFSLNFEVVYFVESNDYTAYMDAQQQINLAIKQSFEDRQIEFAYPTQTLYLNEVDLKSGKLQPESSQNGHSLNGDRVVV